MCGIAGFSLSPEAKVNAKRLAKAMLLDIESRGHDATGFAFIDSTGAFQVHKQDETAAKFVQRRLCLPKNATAAIMHTRFATQGAPEWNANNHPIATGAVVGVHNGHVSNDDDLFKEMAHVLGVNPRIAAVDSEAIFACLNYYNCDRKQVLEAVGGGAAIAWLDARDEKPGTLHLARLNSSPLVVAETADGSVLFASTQSAVVAGAIAANLIVEKIRFIAEGTYITVNDGEYTAVETFKPLRTYRYINSSSSYDYRGTGRKNYAWYDEEDFDMYGGSGIYVPKSTDVVPSTSLDRRLSQEEPDFGSTPADADAETDEAIREYQDWWKQNTRAIENGSMAFDAAVNKDDEKEKRNKVRDAINQKRFERFLAAPRLNAAYITDGMLKFTEPTEMEYLADPRHVEREYAIERWSNQCKTDEATRTKVCLQMKAHVRPGWAISTQVAGQDCFGVIVDVPNGFPGDDFLLRVYVPLIRRPTGYEAVFVSRKYWEFDLEHAVHANLGAQTETARPALKVVSTNA